MCISKNNINGCRPVSSMDAILQKIIRHDDFLNRCVFTTFTTLPKFTFVRETLANPFIKPGDFLDVFCRYQRVYHALAKFVSIVRFKRAKIVIDTDLCLNPISIGDANVICLRQGSGRYLFLINDLIKIIQSSVANSQSFFSMPKSAKNPYTNIPFDKSTLYNIFFFVLFRTIYRPELLFVFFQYNFNLRRFATMYEHEVREHAIDEYVEKSDIATLHVDVLDMLANFDVLDVDPDFPPETLVRVMKPYLHLWLTAAHSLIGVRQSYAVRSFLRLMVDFARYNPQFGRKIVKIEHASLMCPSRLVVSFNDKHAPMKPPRNFMTNHQIA